jgi:hypothetical protein
MGATLTASDPEATMTKPTAVAVEEPLTIEELTARLLVVREQLRIKDARYSILALRETQGKSSAADTAERTGLVRDRLMMQGEIDALQDMLARAQRAVEVDDLARKRDELGQATLEYIGGEQEEIVQIAREEVTPALEGLKAALQKLRAAQRRSYDRARRIAGLARGARNHHMRETLGNALCMPSTESALARFVQTELLKHDVLSLDRCVTLQGYIPAASVADAIREDVALHINTMQHYWSAADLLEGMDND